MFDVWFIGFVLYCVCSVFLLILVLYVVLLFGIDNLKCNKDKGFFVEGSFMDSMIVIIFGRIVEEFGGKFNFILIIYFILCLFLCCMILYLEFGIILMVEYDCFVFLVVN